MDPEEAGDDEEDIDSDDSDGSDYDAETGDGGKGKTDETYRRIKLMLENLLDSGRRALEKTKEDHMDAKGGTKVLTAEEVETWRGSTSGGANAGRLSDSESHPDTQYGDGGLDDIDDDDDGYRNRSLSSHSPTPQPATRNGSVVGSGPRNSNPTSSTPSTTLSSPKPPPILITEPR